MRLFAPADVAGVELLDAAYVTHTFARHAHDEFALAVVERGADRFEYRGASHLAPAGRVLLFNPGELHTGRAAGPEGWRMRMLFVSPALLRGAADAEAGGSDHALPDFGYPVVDDPRAAALLRAAADALAAPTTTLAREAALLAAFAHLLRQHAAGARGPDAAAGRWPMPGGSAAGRGRAARAVRGAREYLDAHAGEQVALGALARIAGLSPFHLARAFRAEVGAPPHVYLEQVRVRRAKALLRGRLPLGQVALEAGFVDQSHFTKRFRAFVGATPDQYRRGCAGEAAGRAAGRDARRKAIPRGGVRGA